jgi:hypothetical protein
MIAALSKLPGASYVRNRLYRWPVVRSLAVAYLYPVERRLVRSAHTPRSDHPSIIHFSINKAATQYVRNILTICAEENALIPVQFNQYASWMTIPYLDRMSPDEFERYKCIFKPRGYSYSVFSRMIKGIPDLDSYRKILFVRDPRDVVTSYYYSMAYSHPLPGDPKKAMQFQHSRQSVLHRSIDEFAIDFSAELMAILEDYMKMLVGRPNLHVTRYEDMIADFEHWLDKLLSFCSLAISEATRARLIASSAASVPSAHRPERKRRQVTPGDHRRKLKAETIVALNDRFGPALDCFGYLR